MSIKKFYRKKITVSEAIDIAQIFNTETEDKFARFPDLYGKDEGVYNWEVSLDTICYLDDPVYIIDDNEVYPKFVTDNKFSIVCVGEDFIYAYDHLEFGDRDDLTKEDFIQALNYYLENDVFLDD